MRRCAWILMHDRHAAKGDTLGSYERAKPRCNFPLRGRTKSTRHLGPLAATTVCSRCQKAGENPTSSNWCEKGQHDSLPWWGTGEHRPHPGPRGRVPAEPVRFQAIAECIRSEDRRARKPRLQILAARFDQEIDNETTQGLIIAGRTKSRVVESRALSPLL